MTLLRVVLPVAATAASISVAALPAAAAVLPDPTGPKAFGTSFQSDPGHDFTKHLSPRRDGVLRGWVTHYRSGVAEYEPIRWVKDRSGHTEGYFEGPPEGDATAYASRVAKNVVFFSATGCKGTTVTVNDNGLGSKRCRRNVLVSRMKAGYHPAFITIHRGVIVKVQEIYTP